jgi:hypothetical protein
VQVESTFAEFGLQLDSTPREFAANERAEGIGITLLETLKNQRGGCEVIPVTAPILCPTSVPHRICQYGDVGCITLECQHLTYVMPHSTSALHE